MGRLPILFPLDVVLGHNRRWERLWGRGGITCNLPVTLLHVVDVQSHFLMKYPVSLL